MNKTVLPRLVGFPSRAFDSQSFWDAMDLVKEEDILAIEEKVWAKTLNLYHVLTDVLFYDTTNFLTYIDSLTPCKLPQRGKSKKGGNKERLVGLALASTDVLGLPFLHKVYEGNCHDAKLFPEAMSLTVKRYSRLVKGVNRLTIVFDKGNNSHENMHQVRSFLDNNNVRVFCIGSLKPSHTPIVFEDTNREVYRRSRKIQSSSQRGQYIWSEAGSCHHLS